MRIEIDTNKDSRESIVKAIRLLSELMDEPLTNLPSRYPESDSSRYSDSDSQYPDSDSQFSDFSRHSSPSAQLPSASAPLPSDSSPTLFAMFGPPQESTPPSSASPQNRANPSQSPSSASTPLSSDSNPTVFDLFKQDKPAEKTSNYDPEYDDEPIIPKKPKVFKERELKGKKWNFPENEISIIEY